MVTVIIFIIVLAVLILVHEFGHFISAKKLGIRVDEFGLGFPPKLWGKKKGETEYTINSIPFGGFVKIFGENPDDISENGPDSKRSFVNKPKWVQAIVLVAGVFFNFVFAWILISITFFLGVNASVTDYAKYTDRITDKGVTVAMTVKDKPAYNSGLRLGDTIKSIEVYSNQKGVLSTSSTPITVSSENLKNSIESGNVLKIGFTRGGVSSSTLLYPEKGIITSSPDKFAVGISMDDSGKLSLPIHLAIYEGARYTMHAIYAIAVGLGTFIAQIFTGTADYSTVSGPVGIAGLVGDAARAGIVNLLMFTALISINLGVINLAPFPALDGGRLLFVAIEAIIRRRIPRNFANTLNTVGFVLLLLLMVFVTFKDIIKLF